MSNGSSGVVAESTAPLKIVVGVAGGIAAYKSCHIIRAFKEDGHDVKVIPTSAALEFVGQATFEALSGNAVSSSVFDKVPEVEHVKLGQEADLLVLAPATADLISRIAAGRADDLLSATVLVSSCPVVLAPAMHTEMWFKPATQGNVEKLRSWGMTVIEPAHGRLTGADTGAGRLPEPRQIVDIAYAAKNGVAFEQTLKGKKIVISAGGTQENLDPVRFLGNRSSGRQGFALAEISAQRGGEVIIIAGSTDVLPLPSGASLYKVNSAAEMYEAMHHYSQSADLIIMAAAVADFRPANTADSKLKKGSDDSQLNTIHLTENPDILKSLVAKKQSGSFEKSPVIIGFAAETGDERHTALEYAQLKLRRKQPDLLMCNEVGEGKVFGQTRNSGWILDSSGSITGVSAGSKLQVAAQILDAATRVLHS